MAQLVLELEHSFVRTPLEALSKSCRLSQKLCEKAQLRHACAERGTIRRPQSESLYLHIMPSLGLPAHAART